MISKLFRSSNYSSRGRVAELIPEPRLSQPCPAKLGEFHSNIERISRTELRMSRSPIEFSSSKATLIYNFLLNNSGKDLRFIDPGRYLNNIFGSELKRFMCSIQAYYDSPNPVMDYFTLIKLIHNKDAAKLLKKIRDRSMRKYFTSYCFVHEENTDEYIYPNVRDVGDIFNYNYWFFWKEDPVDDIRNSHLPIENIGDDDIEIFRNTLLSMLPENVEEIDEREVLMSTSGSSCFESDSKYVYQKKQIRNSFSKDSIFGKRCLVYVSPDNVRDTIILPVKTSNTVKLLEKQICGIAERIRGSAYIPNEKLFRLKVESFFDKFLYFIERDILKEGLTKPRQLISIVFDCLRMKYPHIRHWEYGCIYDNFKYVDFDGEVKSTTRGHGLGMANAITTIIQCVLFEIIKSEMILEESIGRDTECIVFNDDMTIGFKDKDSLELYWDIEESILNKYQIIRRDDKSYRNVGFFVFCENYLPTSSGRKTSYKLAELYNAFAMPNIAAAKLYVNSLSGVEHPTQEFSFFLKELVTYYGYEFFYGEWEYPFRFGGWITPSYGTVDISLTRIKSIDNNIRRSFLACLVNISDFFKGSKKGKLYRSPLEVLFGDRDYFIPDEIGSLFNYKEYESRVDSLFRCRNDDNLLNIRFSRYLKKRREIFEKIPPPLQHIDFFSILRKKNILKDFLPNTRCIIEEKVIRNQREEIILPSTPTPLLSIIKKFNMDKMPEDIIPYISIRNDTYSIFEGILDRQIRIDSFFSRKYINPSCNGEYFRMNVTTEDNYVGYNDLVQIINANIDVNNCYSYPGVRFNNMETWNNEDYWDEVLTSPNRYIFLRFIRKHGIKKFETFISSLVGADEDKLMELFDLNEEEPIQEPEDQSDEKVYGIRDYVQWELDEFPVYGVKLNHFELFVSIMNIRRQIDLFGDADHGLFQTPDGLRDFAIDKEIWINLTGGVVTHPRDGFWFVTYSALDDNDTSEASDKTEDFSLFDE